MINTREINDEFKLESKRAQRVSGYLNDLLTESLPQESQFYEVVSVQVNEYVNDCLGKEPVEVSLSDRPTYEFYIKPKKTDTPQKRVMILHGPDLRARIPGGMKNERKHFYVDLFKDVLVNSVEELR